MTSSDQNSTEKTLRNAFRTMNADQAQAIREAYYKAVEGLQRLAETLEIADLEVGEHNDHALIEEHLIACMAMETMNQSLGAGRTIASSAFRYGKVRRRPSSGWYCPSFSLRPDFLTRFRFGDH
ncbi:MAG: hypothetical protein JWM11_4520 [Planctomycetaceae bacterium]|nr:hypothetical protein [Planctomycetaceae bacterium]